MTAVIQMLASFSPEAGRPTRGIGLTGAEEFALFDVLPTGAAVQVGRGTTFADACAIATAVLDEDDRAKSWPHTAHVLALALLGAAWSGAPGERAAAARVASEDEAARLRAAKQGLGA